MNDRAVIRWRSHPARERPRAAVAVCVVIVALAGLSAELMGHFGWGVFAALSLATMLHRFFLPTEYRIDADGVAARSAFASRHLRWGEIRRFAHDERGGVVSSRARASVFAGPGDIPLLFPAHRDEVVAAIRAGMARQRAEEAAPCSG